MRLSPAFRVAGSVLVAVAVLAQSGCSFFASGQQMISVTSEPTGARVSVNGNEVGLTPVTTSVSRGGTVSIMVVKNGYRPQTRTPGQRLSKIGILDVVGGCIWLVPFLGLLSDGAWEVEPEAYSVVLEEED